MAGTLVDQSRAKVQAVESRIEALRQLRRDRIDELGRVSAELRGNPGDVELSQTAEGLRLAIADLNRQIPERQYGPGQPRPQLQLDLEKARQDLENVRRAGWNLRRSVARAEATEAEWGGRLPRILAGLDDLLSVIGPGRFPEKHQRAEVQLRALRAWAVETSNTIRTLPALRSGVQADYGDDDGWEPPEVRERGILGKHPESVRSKWHD